MKKYLAVLLAIGMLFVYLPVFGADDGRAAEPDEWADRSEELLSGTMLPGGNVTQESEEELADVVVEPVPEPVVSLLADGSVARQVTLEPTDDTFVQGGGGSGNVNGTNAKMTVRGDGYYRIAYLKFDLSSVAGSVEHATLRLYKITNNTDEHWISTASNDWVESTMNYNTMAAFDKENPVLKQNLPEEKNVYVEFDLAEAFAGGMPADGMISFAVFSPSPKGVQVNVDYNSKEAKSNKPQLVLDTVYTPEPAGFVLSGSQTVIPPQEQAQTQQFSVAVTDQCGESYEPREISWAVSRQDGGEYAGLSIDASGLLTVSPGVEAGEGVLAVTADGVEHSFPLYIFSEQQAVERARDEFALAGLDYVLSDLELPTYGPYGTVISWSSSDESVLENDGTVHRPEIAGGDREVMLTATFAYGDASAEKVFQVYVVRQSMQIMLLPDGKKNEKGESMGGNTLQDGGGKDNTLPGQIMVRADKYRLGLLKYDLSGIDAENIISARVEFDGGRIDICAANTTYDDWDPADISYNKAKDTGLLGNDVLAEGYMNANNLVEIDLTDAIKADYTNDPSRVFSFYLYSSLTAETNISFGAQPRLYIDAVYDPEPASVRIAPLNRNETFLARPLAGRMKAHYIATVIDQNGGMMMDEPISWSVGNDNASVERLGKLGEIDEWPKSDVVVPVGTTGNDIAEVTIWPETSGSFVQLQASAAGSPGVSGTLDIEIRDSIASQKAHPFVLHSEEDLPMIRERVKAYPLSDTYSSAKITASKYSVEDLKPENIYQLNPWRPDVYSFQVPEGVASADIGIYLDGRGEVGFDSAEMLAIDSKTITLKNPSFETGLSTPNNWDFEQLSGSGTITYEKVTSGIFHTWNGSRYVKVHNDSQDDLTGVTYRNLELTPKAHYTFTMNVSQLDKVDKGCFIIVRYKDKAGNYLPEKQMTSPAFNRITFSKRNSMPGIEYANVYMIENNMEYAEKSKLSFLYFLYDAQWGMQYWINTGVNLDDTYQAVHMGRRLYDWAMWYDRFAGSGIFTPDEDNIIREKMYWIAETMMDTKYYDYTTEHNRRHNYNTDRSNGLMAFALAFPEYGRSAELYKHAEGEIIWQFTESVGKDGSWPECVRYHAAVMTKVLSNAPALKRIGDRAILDLPEFKQMVNYLIEVQTPRDAVNLKYHNGALYPAIGDVEWGDATGVLPYVILAYMDSEDPADIDMVQRAKYAYIRQNDTVGIADYFTDPDKIQSIVPKDPNLATQKFDDGGMVIFRQDYGLDTEDYVVIQASSANVINSHQNNDRGTFSMFMDNTPLMLDAGVGSYTDGSGEWYSKSSAHNMVSFYNSGEEMNLDEKAGTIELFQADPMVDHTKIGVPDNSSIAAHKRNFAFVKGPFDMLLVSDAITMKNQYPSKINYNTLSSGVSVNGNTVTAHCYNSKELDVTVLEPENPQFDVLNRGLVAGAYPKLDDKAARQDHVQVANAVDGDYFTVFYPKREKTAGLKTEKLAANGAVTAYRIENPDGEYVVAVVNNATEIDAASARQITFDAPEPLTALIDGTGAEKGGQFVPEGGTITVDSAAATIQVLAPASVTSPSPSSMEITGAAQMQIPSGSGASEVGFYTAIVRDQYGHKYTGEDVTYSVSGSPGVSIDETSGMVSVSAAAKPGSLITVTASVGGLSDSFSFGLVSANTVLKSLEITGSDTLAVPASGMASAQYQARVLDEYQTVVPGQKVIWSVMGQLPEGVRFQPDSATVTVEAGAQPGESFMIKASSDRRPSLFQVMKITLAGGETAAEVVVSGPERIQAGASAACTATVNNQYGQSMPNQPVAWSVSGGAGITITDGLLRVDSSVAAGTVAVVTAVSGGISGIRNVTVTARPSDSGGGGGGGTSGGGGGGGITPILPNPATPTPPPAQQRFRDLGSVPWAEEAINTLAERGIVSGKEADVFAPEDSVTREEFVKLLLGVLAITPEKGGTQFSDVDPNAWYYDAISTAQTLELVTGRDDGSFGVGERVSRQDMAVMLSRAAEKYDVTLTHKRDYLGFGDEGQISDYAKDAVARLYVAGIISGRSETEFAPLDGSTRAEAAVMLYRFLEGGEQ